MCSDIEQRLERLERSNRRYRWTMLVIIMLVPTMAAVLQSEAEPDGKARLGDDGNQAAAPRPVERDAMATGRTLEDVRRDYGTPSSLSARPRPISEPPPPPLRIVDAEVFAVVDRQGNVRAEIGVDQEDQACLRMYDRQGNRRVELVESRGDTSLTLLDPGGARPVELRQMGPGGELSLGVKDKAGKSSMQLVSQGDSHGIHLRGSKPEETISMVINSGWHDEPQLIVTGADTHSSYRSNGMWVSSDDAGGTGGGISFYLLPSKSAGLNMRAGPIDAGEGGMHISTSPTGSSLWLHSQEDDSNARLAAGPDGASFWLRPPNPGATLEWSIRDEGDAASSRFLMYSGRDQQSVEIKLDKYGPRMNFFTTEGNSLFSTPDPPAMLQPEKPSSIEAEEPAR